MTVFDDRLALVLDVHLDPRWGSAFWLERSRDLGFDPRKEIREVRELPRLGSFPLEELARRPIQHFIPRRFHDRLRDFVTAETGGTTGPPKRTAYREDEFQAAFVTPFVEAAHRAGFPRGRPWLFLGPSGPHVIGKAARACARAMDSLDPFSVDLDPRWVRRLPVESLARRRYLAHVLEQAEAILASQEIGVLFGTPPTLDALAERLPHTIRHSVEGIHLGGMAAEPAFWRRLEARFPRAVVLAGYGNSLAGMAPQLGGADDGRPAYFPHGMRWLLQVEEPGPEGRGRVLFHRLDESALLANVLERDEASSEPPPEGAPSLGFVAPGLRDPRPWEALGTPLAEGLY